MKDLNKIRIFDKLVRRVICLIGDNAQVLDLGGGKGFFAKCCQEHGLENVKVIDLSPSAIQFSKRLGIDSKVHNIKDPLPFGDKMFDLVMYHEVYEHISPEVNDKIFREVYRVLKPNGYFWVITTCKYNSWDVLMHPTHINNTTPTALLKYGESFGFDGKRIMSSFNISLFLPILPRKTGKKYRLHITALLSPIWMPLWFVNKYIKLPLLDFMCGNSKVLFKKPVRSRKKNYLKA